MQQSTFAIITTTHNRPELLKRAVASVLTQKCLYWNMIIVNDSPEYDYSVFEKEYIEIDPRITYVRNQKNIGKNASVNKALELLQQKLFEGYIIFLDDDDWFSKNALEDIQKIVEVKKHPWIVTQRIDTDGIPFTVQIKKESTYTYFIDYLLGRKLTGDATHCIHSSVALHSHFSKKIKNGEEWFYYVQLPPRFMYAPIGTTISNGYIENGLNNAMQVTYKKNTRTLFTECLNFKMFLYLTLRTVRLFFK